MITDQFIHESLLCENFLSRHWTGPKCRRSDRFRPRPSLGGAIGRFYYRLTLLANHSFIAAQSFIGGARRLGDVFGLLRLAERCHCLSRRGGLFRARTATRTDFPASLNLAPNIHDIERTVSGDPIDFGTKLSDCRHDSKSETKLTHLHIVVAELRSDVPGTRGLRGPPVEQGLRRLRAQTRLPAIPQERRYRAPPTPPSI